MIAINQPTVIHEFKDGVSQEMPKSELNSAVAYDLIHPALFAVASARSFDAEELEVDLGERFDTFFDALQEYTGIADVRRSWSIKTEIEYKIVLLQANTNSRRVYTLSECHVKDGQMWNQHYPPKILRYKIEEFMLPF